MLVVLQWSRDLLVVTVALKLSKNLPVVMLVLLLSRDVMVVLQFSQDLMVVLVVLQTSQDLLVEHMIVHQQPPSVFEADGVQSASWKEFIHHNALADLWERTGQGRSG